MKKKIISMLLALTMLLGLAAVLASCGDDTDTVNPDAKAESFIALDINPSVELTVDENGYVLSAYGANEDAQVLLYGESGIVGTELEVAVEKITDLAVELGYINAENKVISASVYAGNEASQTELESKITASVDKAAKKAGITLTVTSEELYSIIRELEAYKAQNPDSAAIQALTPAKYRLAISASENGDITLEAAISLDDKTLIEKIDAAHKKAEAYATDAFKKAREDASEAYELAADIAEDAAYLKYFTDKYASNSNPLNVDSLNLALYTAYANAAKGLEALEIASEYMEEENYELTDDEVAAVLDAFGLEKTDKEKLQNLDGKITIRSVEAYTNKVLKNLGENEREALEDTLDDLLDDAEDRIEVLVDEAIAAYKPEVDRLIETVENALALIVNIPGFANVKAEFDATVAQYNALIADGTLSEDDIEELEDLFDDKADYYQNVIESKLTPEEKTELEAKCAAARAGVTSSKAEFDAKLAAAEAEAKAHLEELKNARRH